MSPCMEQFIGKTADAAALCTADLTEYPDAQAQIEAMDPAAFSVCVYSSQGKALVTVFLQAATMEQRDEIFDKERRSIGGTTEDWARGDVSGQWAAGVLFGSEEPEIVWKFDDVPLVAVLTTAPGSGVTADELKAYWESTLLPAA